MTVAELQTACKERGMRAVGLTKEKLVTRLEIIQQEQEKIELEAKEQERLKEEKERKALEEKAKAERLAQAALEQAIEEQSVRMPPPAPPTAEGVVREATSILR